ncbi:hypothetical protein PFICI_12761 [Pestalotiopsis fici W106-1]|uniref:ATP-grasp domain-containing protein n=1 Tax=Pestalotiopsis fici (strain W106-1 / CGMCC3.15140) TaxID=1229662 RepID=W3WRQ8_PESFW|nr:uncharacterized protein PFICI_12761 [Pestalotiopsis fici W106-1]ETS75817.1 hypothetical protein PFICI_12761 [Pestalotiopsis fici W106-1]
MIRMGLYSATRSLALVAVSVILAPWSIALALLVIFFRPWASMLGSSRYPKPKCLSPVRSRTVLVTGVGMAKGLTIARAFYLQGHRVVGADFENQAIPCSGRYSKGLSKFRSMKSPSSSVQSSRSYVQQMLRIVREEDVDLWVSCSGVASALEDAKAKELIERETRCKCIQFGVQETETLHEKDLFMREAHRLGLPVPETHNLTCPDDALNILLKFHGMSPARKFILKTVGVDDANRGNMTLLPLDTKEATKRYISRLSISPQRPWILQEFITGGEEYCTHALIVRGEVKCFVACPSAELLMHYRALEPQSALSRAMLAFTREYIFRSPNSEQFTGHLSFDFMVRDSAVDEHTIERSLYAIECNPRAHTAVTLFAQQQHGSGGDGAATTSAMVKAYLSALEETPESYAHVLKQNGLREEMIVFPPKSTLPRFWIAHDLFTLVLQPILNFVAGQKSVHQLFCCLTEFLIHVLTWKEGTFEVWDPWPAVVLYHVYWPLTILSAWWRGDDWSRVNVSTTKMFAC